MIEKSHVNSAACRKAPAAAGMARPTRRLRHPEIAKIGLGNVDPERLKRSIDLLVKINGLPRTPAVDEIFTPAFLPPQSDLLTKLF